MSADERTRILTMLREGKTSVEEAAELLDALGPQAPAVPPAQMPGPSALPPVPVPSSAGMPLPIFLLALLGLIGCGWVFTFFVPKFVVMWSEMAVALPTLAVLLCTISNAGRAVPGVLFLPALLWAAGYPLWRRMPRGASILLACLLLLGLLVLGVLTLVGLFLPLMGMMDTMEKTAGA